VVFVAEAKVIRRLDGQYVTLEFDRVNHEAVVHKAGEVIRFDGDEWLELIAMILAVGNDVSTLGV
jgi:hypothetical protein